MSKPTQPPPPAPPAPPSKRLPVSTAEHNWQVCIDKVASMPGRVKAVEFDRYGSVARIEYFGPREI